ncbi:methionyl-tRNA formyltransferase [Cellulomonas hominis]|nr:methionyl-tRNA formyltransferase [Cellulomonas hominis]
MRLLFAGTPAVALPSLDALLASRHEVVAVLTRPDARAGRGRTLTPSPVKERALEAGIEVLTPTTLRDPEVEERLAAIAPDAAPVVAYGNLVPPAVLDLPRHGWVNLHFSVLPAWRGAAPVQHAIIAGDEVTGASTFRLEAGLDTGPVYGTLTETIRPTDTAGDLLGRLADAGSGLLVRTLDALEEGILTPVPQPGDGISVAPRLSTTTCTTDSTAAARRSRNCVVWIQISVSTVPNCIPPRTSTVPNAVAQNRNTSDAADVMAGVSAGRVTVRNARAGEAPSDRAACSGRGSSRSHSPPTVRTTTA